MPYYLLTPRTDELLIKKKKKEKKGRSKSFNKEYIWLRKKEFFQSFAKQTDAFTILNFKLALQGGM